MAGEPALPVTFRPLGVRIAITVVGGLLLAVTLAMWLAFPPSIQAQFTPLEIVTVLILGAMFAAAGFALARSRVVAEREGLVVVNGYRRRRFDWNQILGITLRPGSPWAVLDLNDGTSVAAMGIQGSDGARATKHVRQLRGFVDRLTRPDVD